MFNHVTYRPPAIRSALGRLYIPRPDSGLTRGSGPGEAPPSLPLTSLELRPGFFRAYGAQIAIAGVAALLGAFGVIAGLTAGPHDKGHSFAKMMLLPSSLLMAVALVLPWLFWARYRKMSRVFEAAGAEVGSPPGAAPPTAASVRSRRPSHGQFVHSTWILLILSLLVAFSLLELLAGFVLLFMADVEGLRTATAPRLHILSAALMIQGAASLGLAYAIRQHRMRALGWVILLSIVSVLSAVATLLWPLILWAVVTCAIFLLIGAAMWRLDREIAAPDKTDPLQVYYHNLLLLLVRVMAADGHCDRRELSKISRLCNGMSLSDYERDLVIASASLQTADPVSEVLERYRMAAEAAYVPGPAQSLLLSALAVATADGDLAAAERAAILDLAEKVGVEAAPYVALMDAHALPTPLDPCHARVVLDVPDDADDAALDAAHARLCSELDASRYAHLGDHLGDALSARRALLDEAHAVLRTVPRGA